MEYHAVEDMESFSRLFEILAQKAANGVEVRLLYDDVGSIGFVNFGFVKKMRQSGIRCKVFNPVLPVLQIFMNNRDHRKITVIDGRVAFTAGIILRTNISISPTPTEDGNGHGAEAGGRRSSQSACHCFLKCGTVPKSLPRILKSIFAIT